MNFPVTVKNGNTEITSADRNVADQVDTRPLDDDGYLIKPRKSPYPINSITRRHRRTASPEDCA